MAKQIEFWDKAREKMFNWMEIVAQTVTVTMWPKWRNVVLDKWYWAPQVTNDWVTIAKEIELEDKFESLWAELVKDAADRTNTLAWDGTTTATLLTYAIAKEWLKNIRTWVNAVELKNGMKKAWVLLIDQLRKNAKQISSKEEIAQVATISAQDSEVWEIIAEAMDKVWNTWVISVEEWQTFWLDVEITEWMEFDQGYLSPYMVTNTDKMLSEMKNTPILITDKKVSNMKDLLPLLEQLVNEWKKDLIIIADDIDWEALTTIILNKLKWVLSILWIKTPWFWDNKKELLQDIAILTWANVFKEDLNMKLENATLDDLWSAKNVISSKDKTIIIWWKWEKWLISERVEEIKNSIRNSDSNYDREKLQERLAKLDWWVAVIKVWAASEVEMKEKKMRIEDALNATRAAVEEWVVAWGWVALLKASAVLDWISLWNDDQNIGLSIVQSSLVYPIKQIVENAWKDSNTIVSKIEDSSDINFWYDASNEEFVNMINKWIIDPMKVERIALEEAISLAWMFLTTEAVVTDIPKKENESSWNPWTPPMWWMGWMWGMWWMPMM